MVLLISQRLLVLEIPFLPQTWFIWATDWKGRGSLSSSSEVQASGAFAKPAWPRARRPPSPTLPPGSSHRFSPLCIKQGRAPPQEKRGGWIWSLPQCQVSQRLYLPSWGQLSFSDHLLLGEGLNKRKANNGMKRTWSRTLTHQLMLQHGWQICKYIQLYPSRVGYGIKTGPHNLLLRPEGERELESMDVFTY